MKAQALAAAEEKAIEDAKWRDTSPTKKHELRKARNDLKREEQIMKKAERRHMEKEEEEELSTKKRTKGKPRYKMTQYELFQAAEKERKLAEKQAAQSKLDAARVTSSKKYVAELDAPNTNRDTTTIEASGVDEVLRVLSSPGIGLASVDDGPMTYKRFEASRMPAMKLDKPGLKASQYRELIKKEWSRSMLNPKNQPQ
jgi:hypothetical protein